MVEAADDAAAMTLLLLMLHLTFEGVDVEVVVVECSLDMSRGLLEKQLGSSDEASFASSTSFVSLFRPNMSASFASSVSTITTEDPVELSVIDEVDVGVWVPARDLIGESSLIELAGPLVEEATIECTCTGEAYMTDTVECDWS